MDKALLQWLLVVIPVLSLIGSWCALKVVAKRQERHDGREQEAECE